MNEWNEWIFWKIKWPCDFQSYAWKNSGRLLTNQNCEIVLRTKIKLTVVVLFLDVGKIWCMTYAVQCGLKWKRKKWLATLLSDVMSYCSLFVCVFFKHFRCLAFTRRLEDFLLFQTRKIFIQQGATHRILILLILIIRDTDKLTFVIDSCSFTRLSQKKTITHARDKSFTF